MVLIDETLTEGKCITQVQIWDFGLKEKNLE